MILFYIYICIGLILSIGCVFEAKEKFNIELDIFRVIYIVVMWLPLSLISLSEGDNE